MLIEVIFSLGQMLSPSEVYETLPMDVSHPKMTICTMSEQDLKDKLCEDFEAVELRYPEETIFKKAESADGAGIGIVKDLIKGVGGKVGVGGSVTVKVKTKTESTSKDGAKHKTQTDIEVTVKGGAGSAAEGAVSGGSDEP